MLWSPGNLTAAQFLERGSALQQLFWKLSWPKLLEGPRPRSTKSLPRWGREVEARKYILRRPCPKNSCVANVAFQKEPELGVVDAGSIHGAAAPVDCKPAWWDKSRVAG